MTEAAAKKVQTVEDAIEMPRMSAKQKQVLEFVRQHPGCTIMAVCRNEWDAPGHLASYARVNRLVKRGILRKLAGCGNCAALYVNGLHEGN